MEWIAFIISIVALSYAIYNKSGSQATTVEELMLNESRFKAEEEDENIFWELENDLMNMEMASDRHKHEEIMEMYFLRWEKLGWSKGKEEE